MKAFKDEFSTQADSYARYRPHYPEALYSFLYGLVRKTDTAWDCGTGNGQVAVRLAEEFRLVYATDISEKQIGQAPQRENIFYSIARAEQSALPSHSVDLVTIGQAIHWFDFYSFYEEVRRVARPGAVVAAWTYTLIQITPDIDRIIQKLYSGILKDYWSFERSYVDKAYKTIPFPFEEIESPVFELRLSWTFDDLLGYLSSWSSIQDFIRKNGQNPVALIEADLRMLWPETEEREVLFPIHVRAGYVK